MSRKLFWTLYLGLLAWVLIVMTLDYGILSGLIAAAVVGGFIGFWILISIGFWATVDDIKGTFSSQREVHHYHRVTIDHDGNPIEVTDYTEEH